MRRAAFIGPIVAAALLAGCNPSVPRTGTGSVMTGQSGSAVTGSGASSVYQDITLPEEPVANTAPSLLQEADRAEVHPGDSFAYTITVENTTADPLGNLSVEDALPAGKVQVLESHGGTVTDQRVLWTIDTLAPHEKRVMQLQVRASRDLRGGDDILNLVTVRGGGLPVTSASNVKVIDRLPQAGSEVRFTGDLEDASAFLAPAGN